MTASSDVPVLLFFGHRALQAKHLAESLAAHEVVRKQSSHCVGVADVDVAVDERRRDHPTRRGDGPLSRHVAQGVGLTHVGNPLAVDDDRPVLNHTPTRVDGNDEADSFDLQ